MPDSIATAINPALLTIDLIVVILVFTFVLAYSYTLGKDHGVTMIQALYFSAFPFFFIPGVANALPSFGFESGVARIAYLIILFLITFFILSRNGLFESPMVPSKWEIGVFGLLFTGLLFAIIGSFLKPDQTKGFSIIVQSLFFGDALLTFWVLAPIGFWILIRGE